ncbi:allophanate hydrolase [Burkholderia dolosa]|uniref:Allophanate hydrolase n=1 Tax=Burkholderia dolosa TaxID=152500 RepID=A0A892IGA0_9BURK|nr:MULTISPECIES: allophanate hydrolase [Burkholderia]AKE01676.1 urea amidolyase [Burkholderia cepacia]AJY11179.1 allophanate hydrolase [Burkholderia dolosa AU0158]AYZ95909.1 allophanate hydrolase [Burkholderia dolosa]ETP61386.1 urea amidolyase [Burkholderia dolosa PC543]MBR8418748.1 allophanate hydrolase [Burkholderia dolosa]
MTPVDRQRLPGLCSIAALRARYEAGSLTPHALVDAIAAHFDAGDPHHAWIRPLTRDEMMRYADALAGRDIAALPLYGVPFAIKDNIDLAGIPTTAACPAYAYVPSRSAPVVERLITAGAIPIGKTNLDQFATGLSGQRSPYGACRNALDPRYASGGSSSGSAVAVALGVAAFSLGTDTAGSGRVPAAFHGLVGLKPTKGVLSTLGVVPACRSLDCVSVFAHTPADARTVFAVAHGVIDGDPYARAWQPLLGADGRHARHAARLADMRFGIPRADQLEFFGDTSYRAAWHAAVERMRATGARIVDIDFSAFLATARLLYEGPWVAERRAALGAFFAQRPDALHPVIREIVGGAARYSAADAFAAFDRLAALRVDAARAWDGIDAIAMPTSATTATVDALEADPIGINARFGYYTNFVNLLDLSAVAVPAGRCDTGPHAGLPFGITFVGRVHDDAMLLDLADAWVDARAHDDDGARARPLAVSTGVVRVAVVGAHLRGEPLNGQLTQRGARFVAATTTAPAYRLYALSAAVSGGVAKPGLVRVNDGGAPIAVEIWEMPVAGYGSFVAGIGAPLGIGTLTLADGTQVQGFLCEPAALDDATDITHFGGWRAYRADGTNGTNGTSQ